MIAVLVCLTMLSSLNADWQATRDLISRYGVGAETNPIIRAIGPDPYFGTLTLATAATCREDSGWRWAAVGVWAVQTLALNTHTRYGTYRPALLFFEVRF